MMPKEGYGVIAKECNKEIVETLTPENSVEYPILETKVVVTNNNTVKRKHFKITGHY